MRVVGRLLVVLAVLVPVLLLSAQVARGSAGSGDGTAVMKCGHWKDGMRLTPGLTNTPTNQSVSGHGRVYGCNKAGGGGTFSATLHSPGATCGDYSLSGTGIFRWANGATSTATLVFQQQPTAPAKFLVSGQITSGLFDSLIVRSLLRFTLVNTGTGALCSDENPVQKIDFTNSQSLQLFTPVVPTTTTTFPRTTTIPQTFPTTVPITAHHTTTTAPPVTTVVQACCAPVPPAPPPNTGALAFTGSSDANALLGLEALLIGGALACFGESRRRRTRRLLAERMGPRSWLYVTIPED
jgi:hypothetical protein